MRLYCDVFAGFGDSRNSEFRFVAGVAFFAIVSRRIAMPFIDVRVAGKLSDSQKENLKSALGKAVSIIHKPESYLMVAISDGADLWFAGKKQPDGAFVAVSLYGSASSQDYSRMTGEITRILTGDYGVNGGALYITYTPVSDWGWNGSNF